MIYIVDRIEKDMAVLETDNGYTEVPCSKLPDGVKEGSVLKHVNGIYCLDEDAAKERRAKLFELQKKLFQKK